MTARPPGSHIEPNLRSLPEVLEDQADQQHATKQLLDGRRPQPTFCMTVVGDTAEADRTNLWVPWRGAVLLDWVTVSSVEGLTTVTLSVRRSGSSVLDFEAGGNLTRQAADGLSFGPSDTLQLETTGAINRGECVQLWFRGYGGGSLQWTGTGTGGGGG